MIKGKELFESYTNIAYSLAGILVYWFPGNLWEGHALLFCFAMQALSAGSFVYHYWKTKPIYLFDWWAMSFVISICTGILADNTFGWVFVLLWQFIYTYFILGKTGNVYLEVGMSALPCLIAILVVKSLSTFGIILAIFLVALYIRSKDPDPMQAKFYDSWQHGVWHILTAIGFGLIMYLK